MKLDVKLGRDSYPILIARGMLAEAGQYLALARRVLVVTDDGVPTQYARRVLDACEAAHGVGVLVTLPQGEASKTLANFEMLCRVMLENGFTRKDCVAAVGGGVVGDLAGFAAACYMRGIDFYNIPTTLLSQVDSSVGGKTAVDLGGIKNIVGAFHQPRAVLIDPEVLKTLDARQFACGAAEIINASTGDVIVSSVSISTKNGWKLVPFVTDMAHEKVDAKLLGFQINDAQTSKNGDAETFNLTAPWTIAESGRLPLDYDAVVSAVSQPVTAQDVLSIVFVLEWGGE